MKNQFKKHLTAQGKKYQYFSLPALEKHFGKEISNLPFSIRILLESALRHCDGFSITEEHLKTLMDWKPRALRKEIPFKPGRVILQDFTGVPCIVDLAAMREQMKRMKGDAKKINPQVPCDLVIDHSLQVDAFGSQKAFEKNISWEFRRNKERYEFLKWGQNTFKHFRVVPPGVGIIHQVNLEYLATGVLMKKEQKETLLYPDSLVGTDSHTTMINGIGIVGWGVGGIEAESVMLGEALSMVMPDVFGVHLTGKIQKGITATDIVLTVTEMLRRKGVVDKFVEFFGPGVKELSLPDRATISNMCPEYGATIGLFPIDQETINYYQLTSRQKEAQMVKAYYQAQKLFDPYRDLKNPSSCFSDVLELNLSSIEPSLAGPKRPQDRVSLSFLKEDFQKSLTAPIGHKGFGLKDNEISQKQPLLKTKDLISHGSVVLAAITSCTNTSNPSVLIGAGLLAQKAVQKGLKVKSYVKTSLTPGSQVVDEYLRKSGLMKSLEKLGFHNVGYGCATCIGNSGPLPDDVIQAIEKGKLVVASVTSGNRNFEGRINPHVKANYLTSPLLVVAYALAGHLDIDLTQDPIGVGLDGENVYLKDIWPSQKEINQMIQNFVTSKVFQGRYKTALKGSPHWGKVKALKSDLYHWNPKSSYIQEPPYFEKMIQGKKPIQDIVNARALVMVGDSITTDHISPAGNIAVHSPSGEFLKGLGISVEDFNSYGSRRGNDRVMARGTFANIRLKNKIAPGTEGSWTVHFPSKKKMSIYEASVLYKKEKTPLIVFAGKEYGTGSSRDWAAKGPSLLGVEAVIAESFERIHRSNLAGMGILPLEFQKGQTAESLGIKGDEVFHILGLDESLKPRQNLKIEVHSKSGEIKPFSVTVRLDTPVEVDYYKNGGILQTVLYKML